MELFVALAAIKLPGLCLHVDGEKWAMQQQLVIIMTWRDEGQVLRWGGGGGGGGGNAIETPRP